VRLCADFIVVAEFVCQLGLAASVTCVYVLYQLRRPVVASQPLSARCDLHKTKYYSITVSYSIQQALGPTASFDAASSK
jgi:hypothetical protein